MPPATHHCGAWRWLLAAHRRSITARECRPLLILSQTASLSLPNGGQTVFWGTKVCISPAMKNPSKMYGDISLGMNNNEFNNSIF